MPNLPPLVKKSRLLALNKDRNEALDLVEGNEFGRAVRLYRTIVSKAEGLMDEDDGELLKVKEELGISLYQNAQYEEAKEVFEELVKFHEKRPDYKSLPEVQETRHNLACTLSELGEYQKAIEIHRSNLWWRRKVLDGGPRAPGTILTRYNLADCLSKVKKFDEAVELDRQTLRQRKDLLGDANDETCNSRKNLACNLYYLGEYHEAQALFKTNVDIKKEKMSRGEIDADADESDSDEWLQDCNKALKAKREEEQKAKREEQQKTKREEEQKAKREEEQKVKREKEQRAKREEEQKAKREEEQKTKREEDQKAGNDFPTASKTTGNHLENSNKEKSPSPSPRWTSTRGHGKDSKGSSSNADALQANYESPPKDHNKGPSKPLQSERDNLTTKELHPGKISTEKIGEKDKAKVPNSSHTIKDVAQHHDEKVSRSPSPRKGTAPTTAEKRPGATSANAEKTKKGGEPAPKTSANNTKTGKGDAQANQQPKTAKEESKTTKQALEPKREEPSPSKEDSKATKDQRKDVKKDVPKIIEPVTTENDSRNSVGDGLQAVSPDEAKQMLRKSKSDQDLTKQASDHSNLKPKVSSRPARSSSTSSPRKPTRVDSLEYPRLFDTRDGKHDEDPE